jgi:hypothetical protein
MRCHDVLAEGNDVFAFKGVGERGDLIADTSKPPNVGLKVVLLIFDDFGSEVEGSTDPAEEPCIGLYYL